MHTFNSKIKQLVIFFISALSIFLMTAAYANASNIFISDTVTADETNENKTIAVWLDSSPASGNVTVTYTITAGTATQGDDYQAGAYTGTLTFTSGGSTVQSVAIEVLQDEIDEDLETVTVVLSNPSAGSTIIQSQATLYITDDDLPPSVNVADNSSAEDCSSANCSGGNIAFEVYLSNPSSKTVEVDVNTIDSSATAGADYLAVSQTLQFAPGSTSGNISIPILNDGSSEDNETIIISLSNPINASLDNSTAFLIIEDDDPAPNIFIDDATANEDVANVTVRLNAPAGKSISVTASTVGGTATENTDYNYFSDNVTFAPGENTKTLNIPIHNDTLYENDEQFQVLLSNPSFGTISDNSSLVTIISDDPKPTVSIASSSASEASDNQTATITLSTASGLDTTVNYATSNGTAIAGSDYVAVSDNVTFAAGETSKTVYVSIIPDNTSEENENYTIALTSSDNNSDIGTNASATMLITNDDTDPTLNIAATTAVSEDNTTANILVSLSAPSGKVVSFDYNMVDGSAIDGQDYTATSGTITIPAYDNSTLIPVTLLTDNLDEATENFQINITSRTNALQGTLTGTVNISDSASTNPPVVSIADASVSEGAGSVALTVSVNPVSGQ
ncbi:MAG: Calx-beta domain-containing protein, partial [Candidatus Puniceispirillaceae bacterium]